MKPKYALRHLLAIAGSSLLAVSSASAQTTLYWSGNGTTLGGAGTWDTSLTRWGTFSGGPYGTIWDNTNLSPNFADIAVFGGTAGTVSLGAPIDVGGLRFDTTGYNITTTGHSLNFAAANNTILFNNIAAASITGPVGGSGNVTLSTSNPATAGTLTLNGTSGTGWGGTTTINAGMTLSLAQGNQALLNTSGITLNGGNITLTNTGAASTVNGATSDSPTVVVASGTGITVGMTVTGTGITGTPTVTAVSGNTITLSSAQTLTNSSAIRFIEGYNRINNDADITSNGGNFTWTNTTAAGLQYAETIGTVDLNRGQLSFLLASRQTNTGNNQILTLAGLTRAADATSAVSFSFDNGASAANQIVISGYSQGFMGPWASYGVNANTTNITDYAVINASNQVVNANIGATAENSASWTDGGGNVTLSGSTILTGNRNLNTLRATSTTVALDLGGFTLETSGVLTGQTTLTMSNGVLTTASGGGNLYITPGWAGPSMTISAAINNNSGTVTLVKSGASTLTLSSTTSNFSGGIVLNAGTLATTADANLGAASNGITVNGVATWNSGSANYARNITINDGAVLSHTGNNATYSGVISGSGSLFNTGSNVVQVYNNLASTFSGTLNTSYGTNFANIGDSSNAINIGGSTTGFVWTGANMTLANRVFTLSAAGTNNIGASGSSGTLTVAQDIAFSGAAGARTLQLRGTNTGANTFAGRITDGPDGASVVSLQKISSGSGDQQGTGTWIISNPNNSYTGVTTTNAGILSVSTLANAGSNSNLGAFAAAGASGISLSGGTLQYTGSSVSIDRGFTLAANSTVDVSRANTALGLGATSMGGFTLSVTGGNSAGSSLSLGATALTGNATLNPTTANLTVASLSGTNTNLVLSGTSFGNSVTGAIATGSGTLTKSGTGMWTLGSSSSSYTGATTISAGILSVSSIGNANANSGLGNFATAGATGISLTGGTLSYTGSTVSVNRGFTLGTANSTIDVRTAGAALGLGDSSLGAFTLNVTGGNGSSLNLGALTLTGAAILNPSINLTIASVTSAAAQNLDLRGSSNANTVSGAINTLTGTLTKSGGGNWTLSGTNGYTGTTSVSGGILRVNGSLNASSAVTVSAGAIGGTGTINGSVSLTTDGGINLADGVIEDLVLSSTLASSGAANSGRNNLTFDLANAGSTTDKLSVVGTTTVANAGGVMISLNQIGGAGNRIDNGTYTLIGGAGTLDAANFAKFRLATTKAFGMTFSLSNPTGDGGGDLALTTNKVTSAVGNVNLTGNSWIVGSNFSGSAVPDYGSNVTINSAIGTSNLNASQDINSLTYGTSATSSTTIAAGTAATGVAYNMLVLEAGSTNDNTPGNGITVNTPTTGTPVHTISANVGLASTQTWTVNSGANLTVSGVVSDFGGGYGLTKAGSGTLYLSAVNTYSGNTVVNGGVLRFGTSFSNTWNASAGALPAVSNLEINNAVVEAYGLLTRDLGTGPGQIQFTGGRAGFTNLQGDNSGLLTFGNAAYTVQWGSDYFKPTTLVLNDIAAGLAGSARIANNLDLNGAARTVEVSSTGIGQNNQGSYGALEGNLSSATGSLIKTGIGTLILNGANTYGGGTAINNGGVFFNQLVSMPNSGAVAVADGTILSVGIGNAGGWITGTSGNGTIGGLLAGLGGQSGGTVTYTGNVNLGLNVAANSSQTYAGTIANVGTSLGLHIGNRDGATAGAYVTTGTLALTGTNTYTGNTLLNLGTLAVGASANLGAASSNLVFNGGTLRITGTALTNFSTIGHGVSFTAGRPVGLDIHNAANTFTVDQVLNQGSGALTVAGLGTLVLNQANTYTGSTTIGGGGNLVLDYSAGQDNRKLGTGGLTFNGGTITLKGGSLATTIENETTANIALNAGGTFIARADTSVAKIRLNGISRAAGGTISFADATIADTDTNNFGASGANGILGGWATLGDNWAMSVNTGAANTAVTAFNSYTTYVNTGGVATTNYLLNGNGSVAAGGNAVGTLKITDSGSSQALALGDNNLTITSTSATALGGIMYAGSSNSASYSITGGLGRIQTSTTNQELIFAVQRGTLTVSALIGASGSSGAVTKSGAGTMEISSNNNFTGAVRVNQGALRLANANATGTNAGGIVVQNGAALELTGGLTFIGDALTISGSGVSSGGALRNVSGSNVYQGSITIGNGGGRINADASSTLEVRNIATALHADVIFGGEGTINHTTTAISGTGGVIKDGAGTTNLNVQNTYTGGTTINAGILTTGVSTVTGTTTGALGSTSGQLTVNGGTLNMGSQNIVVGNLTGTGGVISGTSGYRSLTIGQGDTGGGNFQGSIQNGTGGTTALVKAGTGTITLSGNNTYTGATTVSAGTLIVNGSLASTSVIINGSLGGSGVMASATLSGSGSINPGNSPGIMTASATDPTGGLDYNFEFTAANTPPNYGNAGASINDVLRLTSATPFADGLGDPVSLGAANTITIYLNVLSLTAGQVFTGGFYTDNDADFYAAISSATFQYFLQDDDGSFTYNDATYSAYTGPLGFTIGTVSQIADFGSGNVIGYVTQFTVIPEPQAALLGSIGMLLLLRRRR